MNCKPGDIAQIVRATNAADEICLGALVRCIRFEGLHHGVGPTGNPVAMKDAWMAEPLSPSLLALTQGGPAFVADRILRPLPGSLLDEVEDATQPREVTA